MQTVQLRLSKQKARDLYRQYKTHVHYSKPLDRQIQRAYQLIAQGRVVIQALQSIVNAGLNEDGLPKLAICRADYQDMDLRLEADGGARMEVPGWHRGARGKEFRFPAGSFTNTKWRRATARVPIIPLHLRPKRGIASYHVLWEAEWTQLPPRDPLLLRRIGGDMWLVVAAWDLTEVERAAMAGMSLNG